MRAVRIHPAVAARLGDAASAALADMVDTNNRAVLDEATMQCIDRFERRLVEEASKLRVEMAQLRGDLRAEMATNRVELLRWAFLFWVGQLVSVAGIVGLMLRANSPR